MATITSTANGNWGTGSTWTGGTVPGIGDTAVVNNQVTIDNNYSVGGLSASSTGCLLAANTVTGQATGYRLLVGGGPVVYIAKGLNISG